MPKITTEKLAKIFAAVPQYTNDDEKEICRKLVDQLSYDEQEQAACTSYAYYIASRSPDKPSSECKLNMAMRFARRHLVAGNGDVEKALCKMKGTLKWREALKINDLRRCYDPITDDSEKGMMEKFRHQVEIEYKMQESYVSGFDKNNRAILMKKHRISPHSISEDHIIHTVYLMERAIACTEIASDGEEEKMLSFCDFEKYSRANMPSSAISKPTIRALQDHYPERLVHHVIVWVNGGGLSRMLIKTVWSVVRYFLDSDTREKIIFIFNANVRDNFMAELVDESQAMPFMLATCKQTDYVDMETYLNDVPFSCSAIEKY